MGQNGFPSFCFIFVMHFCTLYGAEKKAIYAPFLKLDLEDIYNSPMNQVPDPITTPVLTVQHTFIAPYNFQYIAITGNNMAPLYLIDQEILQLAFSVLKLARGITTQLLPIIEPQPSFTFNGSFPCNSIKNIPKNITSTPMTKLCFSVQSMRSYIPLDVPTNSAVPNLIDEGMLALVINILKLANSVAAHPTQNPPPQKPIFNATQFKNLPKNTPTQKYKIIPSKLQES